MNHHTEHTDYKTSLDFWARFTTITLPVFLMISLLWMVDYSRENGEALRWPMPLLMHGVLFLVYIFCYAIRPYAYRVTPTQFILLRWIDKRVYILNDIVKVQTIPKDEMRGVMRTFGNGGIFGYTGLFYHSKFGKMTWHATRRSNYILITFKSGTKIVVTPDDMSLATLLESQLNK